MGAKRTGTVLRVTSVRHKDKRVNIPTEELRDFVADAEKAPKTVLYPRDTSLDPQLVWKGKDEKDRHPLEVPAVPIYIQEKIHPQAIIEQILIESRAGVSQEPSLFDDFNGLDDFEKKVDFYHWGMNWSNRMILGDSLLVMTSLAEKEGLRGKVQMIYVDPPYGIKFGSNWQVSTRKRDVRDGKVEDLTRQPEQIRAFRDTWELGIHSYLTYLRDRLVVARELLTETGSIFVQIGDTNVHLVRCVLDEVFGSENFVSLITFATTSGFQSNELPRGGDYILWYGKNRESGIKVRPLFEEMLKEPGTPGCRWVRLPDGSTASLTARQLRGEDPLPEDAKLYRPDNMLSQGAASSDQTFHHRGRSYLPGPNSHWKARCPEGMTRLLLASRLHEAENSLRYIRLADDFAWKLRNNIWTDTLTGQFTEDKVFVVQTNTKVVERCMLMTTDPGDLVLDPTCGSGTTAYVAEQWGRRWITIDTSRVALAIARTRLMSAKFPYYLLADSPEGIAKDAEITGRVPPMPLPATENDVRKGFIYRRVPHITLKSIANNEEIDIIHARWQEKLEPLRAELNALLKRSWEDWEIPHEAEDTWPEAAKELLAKWWQLRRERQQEIDTSIAHHAESEVLFDQPYEDPKRIRVTGPFSVESLSPHRVLSADDGRPASERQAQKTSTVGQFETMIIENLRKAGVQNTKKNERLKFDLLEPYAGTWVHAAGAYTDRNGTTRRVAVSIGPEHGTVGPEQVKEAAKETLQGVGFDLLVVCGFAFDAHAGETAKEFSPGASEGEDGFAVAGEARQYGKLPVLLARINPDLAMGDELLKKTGAGNLFMVFGEPDVDIQKQPDGKIVVEIRGVDVYDPTTGEVRSSSTDDIACWFIDTNYDSESFFVRHAYFTGADEPYEKLKRALRAEINEAAWSVLYSTRSRPFDPPATGKIAVKVINHYGDEVLKVFEV